MEPARGRESPLDQFVGDTVVQGVKETDIFAGVRDFSGNAFERPSLGGEIGAVVDDRDPTGGGVTVSDLILLKQVHRISPSREMLQL